MILRYIQIFALLISCIASTAHAQQSTHSDTIEAEVHGFTLSPGGYGHITIRLCSNVARCPLVKVLLFPDTQYNWNGQTVSARVARKKDWEAASITFDPRTARATFIEQL